MNTIGLTLSCLAFLLVAFPSFADLRVQFIEGAPKDRFIIENFGDCDLGALDIVIDVSASEAGLIFDTTGVSEGVGAFQPFEVTKGEQYLLEPPKISDGDQRVTLNVTGLGQDGAIAFTIDVDDTAGSREITVSDGEISGTSVTLLKGNRSYSAVMDTDAQVVVETEPCSP